jgi:hypothetical protein
MFRSEGAVDSGEEGAFTASHGRRPLRFYGKNLMRRSRTAYKGLKGAGAEGPNFSQRPLGRPQQSWKLAARGVYRITQPPGAEVLREEPDAIPSR